MARCFAAFGHNDSYFLHSPQNWSMGGLPELFHSLFTTEPKAQEVHEVALGPDGSFAIIFTDRGGIKIRHNNLPPGLIDWLISASGRSISKARDLPSMQIALGPNGSYFALDKNGASWADLPDKLNAALDVRRETSGDFKPGAYPRNVALGANSTYVMLTVGGGGCWNLGRQCEGLKTLLKTTKNLNSMHVVLSPAHTGYHLLITDTGHCAGSYPAAAAESYDVFKHDWQTTIQPSTPPPAYDTKIPCETSAYEMEAVKTTYELDSRPGIPKRRVTIAVRPASVTHISAAPSKQNHVVVHSAPTSPPLNRQYLGVNSITSSPPGSIHSVSSNSRRDTYPKPMWPPSTNFEQSRYDEMYPIPVTQEETNCNQPANPDVAARPIPFRQYNSTSAVPMQHAQAATHTLLSPHTVHTPPPFPTIQQPTIQHNAKPSISSLQSNYKPPPKPIRQYNNPPTMETRPPAESMRPPAEPNRPPAGTANPAPSITVNVPSTKPVSQYNNAPTEPARPRPSVSSTSSAPALPVNLPPTTANTSPIIQSATAPAQVKPTAPTSPPINETETATADKARRKQNVQKAVKVGKMTAKGLGILGTVASLATGGGGVASLLGGDGGVDAGTGGSLSETIQGLAG